jgi:hypothetical protein
MARSLSSAAEDSALSNSAARADLIREAVRWLAGRESEVQAINADIREYRTRHIKGELGFKLSDWAAIYRVSQLEPEDRDALLDTLREGFAAIGIGQTVDWVDAARSTPPRRGGNGGAEPNESARLDGHHDGMSGRMDYADRYPPGEGGHGDYMLGFADGEAERDRVMALGDSAEPPRRGRGRPRKQPQQEAEAEF